MDYQKNILVYLEENADKIQTIEQIEELLPEFLEYFANRIKRISLGLNNFIYNELSVLATQKAVEGVLKSALESFYIKKRHWKQNRKIIPYLSSALKHYQTSEYVKTNNCKSFYKCPICSSLLASVEGGNSVRVVYTCLNCTELVSYLESLKVLETDDKDKLELYKIFATHSGSGCACPQCNKFIPNSYIENQEVISCVYPDCSWFGSVKEMKVKIHPSKMTGQIFTSDLKRETSLFSGFDLNNSIKTDEFNKIELLELVKSNINTVNKVISIQKAKLVPDEGVVEPKLSLFKKEKMYEAFELLMETRPEDLSSYLTCNKRLLLDQPIQSMIFQKYIELIENQLPINYNGKQIYSVLDHELELFLGESEFETFVEENHVIKNKTHEIYIGAKCDGPCYMGYLSNVMDVKTGKSLLQDVEYYTFQKIKMKDSVAPRTNVKVNHYRIPPHYEMFSLVLLQRIRKKIVNSVYKRLNGEDRPLRNKPQCISSAG